MTVEQIELRKILSQMLADNGVNRETIMPMVKGVIAEKTDKAAKRIAEETNLDKLVYNIIREEIADAVRKEVRNKVNRCFTSIGVSVDISTLQ
mgnify:CR=1 FL=1